jgi:hypothetical protein
MSKEKIESLVKKYEAHEHARYFIESCFKLFGKQDPTKFIELTFKNNPIQHCTALEIMNVSDYWHLLAESKKKMQDFAGYLRARTLSVKYTAIAYEIEFCSNSPVSTLYPDNV